MKIHSVGFAGSMAEAGAPLPVALPQVAFSGRSNVGKSSLINCLIRRTRRRLAQVSSWPGKTRHVNFYVVNGAFALVDLPGLGYARVARTTRREWARLVEAYLSSAPDLRGVAHLVDARRGVGRPDRSIIELLSERAVPVLFVATKIDKLPLARRAERVGAIARDLGVGEEQVLPFSARTGEGREELLWAIAALLDTQRG